MRAAITIVALFVLAVPAWGEDGTGGHLGGSFTANWTSTGGSSGSVRVALDPGVAARDAAVAKIKAGPHMRSGAAFSTEGAHVTALTSTRSTSYDCGNGDGSMGGSTTTYGPVSDNDTPFFIDRPFFDLLRGTGRITINPIRDNYGDPLPESGRDFYPVPGQVAVHSSSTSCIPGEPASSEDDVAQIWGAGTDNSAVPFGVPIFLESWEIPLRKTGSTWGAAGKVHDAGIGSVQTDVDYDLTLLGPMRSWLALCAVPDYKGLAKARSAKAAVALVKRAGWPKARFAGRLKYSGYPHHRYVVDPKFTSSGLAGCLEGKPKVFLAP